MPVSPATQEVETERISVQNQLGKKLSETPSQQQKLGIVTHACPRQGSIT
jgi:hypothetical protein